MSEFKYTTDGKKVVVIGSLNSQEKIVQEVFIANGQELPSGENFVVKSLHDAPAKSWLNTEVERLTAYRKDMNDEIDKLRVNFYKERETLSKKMNYFRSVCRQESLPVFDTIAAYLNGEMKYLVLDCGDIMELNEAFDGHQDELRLLAIYGRDDGTLSYKSHVYRDGSDRQRPCLLFRTLEEATREAQRIFDENHTTAKYGDYSVQRAVKYGLKMDEAKLQKYKEDKIALKKLEVDKLQERFLKEQSELTELIQETA